jgi:hypothetical protein
MLNFLIFSIILDITQKTVSKSPEKKDQRFPHGLLGLKPVNFQKKNNPLSLSPEKKRIKFVP